MILEELPRQAVERKVGARGLETYNATAPTVSVVGLPKVNERGSGKSYRPVR